MANCFQFCYPVVSKGMKLAYRIAFLAIGAALPYYEFSILAYPAAAS
jgi:hypothetical protein